MIKLQDFARECGITDRQVQRLLKKYEEEVKGLYQRKGPNGTWLTEEACEILRSKMKQLPPAVIDGEIVRKNAELKQRIRELEGLLSEKERLVDHAQQRVSELQEKVGTVLALEEDKREAERRVKFLEESKASQEAQIHDLSGQVGELTQKVRAAEETAQETSERAQKAEEKERAMREYVLACAEYNRACEKSLLVKLFRKPPAVPELPEE